MTLTLTRAVLLTLAVAQASLASASSVLDRYTLQATFVEGSETYTNIYGKGTTTKLGELYDLDYYDALDLSCRGDVCKPAGYPASEHGVCFFGDSNAVNKVCSLLSELSDNDEAAYASGNHASSRLVSCRVAGRGKPVVARFELVHDYVQHSIVVETTIERCVDDATGTAE